MRRNIWTTLSRCCEGAVRQVSRLNVLSSRSHGRYSYLFCECSSLISAHELRELLDEAMTEEEMKELADAEMVCRKFLAWNLDEHEGGGVLDMLAKVLETGS